MKINRTLFSSYLLYFSTSAIKSATQLKSLEIRQNILIKRSIGVSKFCKTTELNQCLKLDSINTIYLKHKNIAKRMYTALYFQLNWLLNYEN